MEVVMKITIQNKIKEILTNNEHCRDEDTYLIYNIWANEMNKDINEITLVETLSLWKNKKISHPSAIMRARRKVQEEFPETRGSKWKIRHKEQEHVRSQLGYSR